ncbi:hypothetical protein ACIA8O_14215 [Kitasatospora sp. NPDC051853]|uniref:hypothetical protein n=1 Tax=Kitasatospora sp. NPDC051853 TaxID=3364058 RepID=UPI0037A245A6
MTTERAYPVLHTPDLAEAVATARDLLALAGLAETSVRCTAPATGPDQWRRLLAALPGARTVRDPFATPVPHDGPWPEVPVKVFQEEAPLGSVEDAFLAALDRAPGTPGTLEWWPVRWPSVPRLHLPGYAGAHSSVELLVNSPAPQGGSPSFGHAVLIHVRGADLERAQWLAERVGRTVIGPAVVA